MQAAFRGVTSRTFPGKEVPLAEGNSQVKGVAVTFEQPPLPVAGGCVYHPGEEHPGGAPVLFVM